MGTGDSGRRATEQAAGKPGRRKRMALRCEEAARKVGARAPALSPVAPGDAA